MGQAEFDLATLADLEWAIDTLRKVIETANRQLEVGEDKYATMLYLMTALLWLKESTQKQRLASDRRIREGKNG